MTSDAADGVHEARNHVCLDPMTGRPAFVAPHRDGKPDDRSLRARRGGAAAPREWCPFCAGNESRTTADVIRSPADASLPWRAKVIPNMFPIVAAAPPPGRSATPRAGAGLHDVVIESPEHLESILEIPADSWRDVWSLCRVRLAAAADDAAIAWATVFKNSGTEAGASLGHVHSQIIGIDLVPPSITAEEAAIGRDPAAFSRLIDAAGAARRVVAEESGVVALVPPAPRQPFETWLVVADPEAHFHATSTARVAAVADLTRDVVGRLSRVAPGCHFNWWLHQSPHARSHGDPRTSHAWHWHVEIVPRLVTLAGFELGTGCHVTTRSAEDSAAMLRQAAGQPPAAASQSTPGGMRSAP